MNKLALIFYWHPNYFKFLRIADITNIAVAFVINRRGGVAVDIVANVGIARPPDAVVLFNLWVVSLRLDGDYLGITPVFVTVVGVNGDATIDIGGAG